MQHWSGAVLRRTWMPATVLIVTVAIAGHSLQQVVPEARSINAVVGSLLVR